MKPFPEKGDPQFLRCPGQSHTTGSASAARGARSCARSRVFLSPALCHAGTLAAPRPRTAAQSAARVPFLSRSRPQDDQFLNDLEHANFLFFWEQANPQTGLIKDRCNVRQNDTSLAASIASVGFGLTAICIGHKRGFIGYDDARRRVLQTLSFIWHKLPTHRGFFYHFANINTGERVWDSEVSSVDTAMLLCGALMCRQYFDDKDIRDLSHAIFDRVEWDWLAEDTALLSHGWTPEMGFIRSRWDYYSELMMMYLLGMGSVTHPLPNRGMVRMEAPRLRVRWPPLHRFVRASFCSPVFAGMVRFPQQARPIRRLLPELDHRH